ncbi:hypothetical protein OTU49_003354, partial [Cherax quadricarinatus]
MSQRGNRPRSWCPRGDSPLRLPEGSSIPSPVAAPGVQGLPPAVASPRSTPTPFKLRRFGMSTERAGSPCTSSLTPATVLPALHMAAAQLEQQQQQRQAAQYASATRNTSEHFTTQFSQQSTAQCVQYQEQKSSKVTHQQEMQQTGVFYPVPQHPTSPPPNIQKSAGLQRPYRHSPIMLRDLPGEPRSPPSSRPGSVVFRDREPWSPTSTSRPTSAIMTQDPRSPTPVKSFSVMQSERDFRSPTPSRPFPFRQKERDASSPLRTRPLPLTQRQR